MSSDVFFSHNSQDKPVVREIAGRLESRGLDVWFDEWDLTPGKPWQMELENALSETKSVAVFFSDRGIGHWEEPEMRAALSEAVKRGVSVIPVLLPGAPGADQLPMFLRAYTCVDLRQGITDELLVRLECGIRGESPDTVRQRAELAASDSSHRGAQHVASPSHRLLASWKSRIVFGMICLFAVAALVVVWQPWRPDTSPPTTPEQVDKLIQAYISSGQGTDVLEQLKKTPGSLLISQLGSRFETLNARRGRLLNPVAIDDSDEVTEDTSLPQDGSSQAKDPSPDGGSEIPNTDKIIEELEKIGREVPRLEFTAKQIQYHEQIVKEEIKLVRLTIEFGALEQLLEGTGPGKDQDAFRAQVLWALGEHLESATGSVPSEVAATLRDVFENGPGALTHSFSNYVLSRWKGHPDPPLNKGFTDADERGWYVDKKGVTMIRIDMRSFQQSVGDILQEDFYMSDREVSPEVFHLFSIESQSPRSNLAKHERPDEWHWGDGVNWYDAVKFCNWLSKQENLHPCYDYDADENTWIPDFQRDGYRLPRLLEWYAASNGGVGKYRNDDGEGAADGWLPPPNRFGLFNMLGGVPEWCGELADEGYKVLPSDELWVGASDDPVRMDERVIVGQFFSTMRPSNARGIIDHRIPTAKDGIGFRVVRRIPNDKDDAEKVGK